MKQFLYLVQSRIKFLDRYKNLESDNADVIYLTFEKKFNKKNFLYLPNSTWGEGRNALIEHAKSLPKKYDYYIMLDDDIDFVKGNFRKFEEEVLKVKPDFAVPLYSNKKFGYYYSRLFFFFRYSHILEYDCCFVCLSQNLFYDNRILPYHAGYSNDSNTINSFYPSDLFWFHLYKYFYHKKIILFNSIIIKNTNNEHKYNTNYHYYSFKENLLRDNPKYKFYIEKYMLINAINHKKIACLHKKVFSKVDFSLPKAKKFTKYFFHYALYYTICFIYISYKVYPKCLIRDIQLNRKIKKDLKHSKK